MRKTIIIVLSIFSTSYCSCQSYFNDSVKTYYGGTIYSLSVLKYFLKCNLYGGANFSYTTSDTLLKENIKRSEYILEDFITIRSDVSKIYKYVRQEPLYFYRKWRTENIPKSNEDIKKIIEDIKKYGCYWKITSS